MAIDEDLFVYQRGEHVYYSLINQDEPCQIDVEDCKIIEEDEYKSPRAEVYKRDSKVTFWFIFNPAKTEYVIYVPVETSK